MARVNLSSPSQFFTVRPFAIVAFSAILVSLFAVFLWIGRRVFLAKDKPRDTTLDPTGVQPEQPIIMTVSAIVLIGLFVASLFIGRLLIFPQTTPESASSPVRTELPPVSEADRADLKALAESVDRSSEEIYSGLEKTKQIIGKTEARKEAIEHGREHASNKLKALADRIWQAVENNQPLHWFDRQRAEHLTEGLK
jgi:NADH:ubiquinone oxidoreductase subunit 5 (subunit L)/multisubunit Na+/H+ antiporter MnhA subunit